MEPAKPFFAISTIQVKPENMEKVVEFLISTKLVDFINLC